MARFDGESITRFWIFIKFRKCPAFDFCIHLKAKGFIESDSPIFVIRKQMYLINILILVQHTLKQCCTNSFVLKLRENQNILNKYNGISITYYSYDAN